MRYSVQIDYAKRVIRLLDPATYSPPSGATLVPFELQDDLPVVSATVDVGNGPLLARLMVDTGASQFVDLNRPFVDAHGLVEALPDAAAVARANVRARVKFLGTHEPSLTVVCCQLLDPRWKLEIEAMAAA